MRKAAARRMAAGERSRARAGFIFSLDALLAALLLIGGIVLLSRITEQRADIAQIQSASEDTLIALQSVKVYEIGDPWVAQAVANGTIPDANVSALEQIGYFWAAGDDDEARRLAQEMVDGQYEGYGVRVTIDGEEVYARNGTGGGEDVAVADRMVSGITRGGAVKGSSATAYLRRIRDKRNFVIVPLGGFVGEGNISVIARGIPSDANVTDIEVEADTERAFELRVNGAPCTTLQPDPALLTPSRWSLPNCTGLVDPGSENEFSFVSSGSINGSLVSGGYVKVAYTTSAFNSEPEDPAIVYRFPRVRGLINLFDGFYVGGDISSMNITLHFLSNYTSYLTIGNASWTFPGSSSERTVTLNDSQVRDALAASGMSYDGMERTTVPLRFGIGNVVVAGIASDTVMVVDTSGSMDWCTSGSYQPCASGDQTKISAAKNSTVSFINAILNASGTSLGLVEFGSSIKSSDALTTNRTPLLSRVNSYTANGGTCICCGVNKARELIAADNQVLLIARSTSGWRYNDQDLSSLPSGWTSLAYNDASWKSGTSPIGWSYSGTSTVISSGNRYEGDYLYRRKFTVTNVSQIESARLYVRSDDGARVYLNGQVVDNDYQSVHSAVHWNRNGVSVDPSVLVEGENIIAVRQWHRQSPSWWPNPMSFDLELAVNYINTSAQARTKSIVVMTDGEATDECLEQDTGSATQDAIQAACDAYETRGIKVYTVGFGTDADTATLSAMAACGQGQYFSAANAAQLTQVFATIGDAIIQSSTTQRAIIEGNVTPTVLYPDSAIMADYAPDVSPPNPNEISFTLQSAPLPNCSGLVQLHQGSRFVDALVTSYSGDQWTSHVQVNGTTVYNLSRYAQIYQSLGDPYRIVIPPQLLRDGNNSLGVSIATDALNTSTQCSTNNTLIYTVAINLSTERSDAVPRAEGCTWRVETEEGELLDLTIPASYGGTNSCAYTSTNVTYDAQDAYQLGAWMVFSRLDFNSHGRLFVNIREEDLEIVVTTISGVPYMWGPAIARVEVRR